MKIFRAFKIVSEIVSLVILLAGCVVLTGWIFDISLLKSISPKFVTMKANTAVCFVLIGAFLFLVQEKREQNQYCRVIARIFGFFVLLLGSATFIEYVFHLDLGIDQFLFREPLTAVFTSSPGRMAFNTSINFILIGLAFCFVNFKNVFLSYLRQLIILLVGVISLLSFLGYLYGASPLYIGRHFSTAMAIHTTVLFLLVCLGFLFMRPQQGLMKNLSSDEYGSQMMRRMLLVSFLIPPLLGWFKIQADRAGLFNNEFGVSFVALGNLVFISLFVYLFSLYLNRVDTKRKIIEAKITVAKKDWEETFDSIDDVITIHDANFNIIRANKAAGTMFGRSVNSLIGEKCHKLYHNLDIPPEGCLACVVFKTGKATVAEVFEPILNAYVEVKAFPRLDEQGNCIGIVHIVRDISERKKADDAVKRAYQELKEAQAQLMQASKMAAVGQLAGGVAHEINNPLTGVLNNVQLIKIEAARKSDFNLDDFKQLLDVIEESALRCKKITQALLDFSHKPKENFDKVALNDALENACVLVEHEFQLINISIGRDLQKDIPLIHGDMQLIGQIVFNMVANAKWAIQMKSGSSGGEITLKTWHDSHAGVVYLAISDTGIGISSDNLTKLFDPFFTTKPVGEGTGLGLALVYSILKTHKGTIDVKSEVGVGTTFILTFPVI